MDMKIGDITQFGEISVVNYDLCFVQFCDPGSKGIKGVYSMTYEEIKWKIDNQKIHEDSQARL